MDPKSLLRIILLSGLLLMPAAAGWAAEADQALFNQIERLKTLRETDPIRYRELIQDKRQALRKSFASLEGGRKEGFRQFVAAKKDVRSRRFLKMKEKNPALFEEFMEKRINRFEKMKAENPERAKKFLARHPDLTQRTERFKRSRAAKFQRINGEQSADAAQVRKAKAAKRRAAAGGELADEQRIERAKAARQRMFNSDEARDRIAKRKTGADTWQKKKVPVRKAPKRG